MALAARHSESPGQHRRIFACDTFAGMPPSSCKDRTTHAAAADSHWDTGTCSAPAAHVAALAHSFGVEIEFVEGDFRSTVQQLATPSVAALHLDADWYESTRAVLDGLGPRVSRGGWIQFDDYGYWKGCREAVDEYIAREHLLWTPRMVDGSAAVVEVPP